MREGDWTGYTCEARRGEPLSHACLCVPQLYRTTGRAGRLCVLSSNAARAEFFSLGIPAASLHHYLVNVCEFVYSSCSNTMRTRSAPLSIGLSSGASLFNVRKLVIVCTVCTVYNYGRGKRKEAVAMMMRL